MPELVASFFTLSGAGFGEPPRHPFPQRCEAAAAAGFAGIGLHVDDLARTAASGLDVAGMRAVLDATGLRLVEIEFLGGWALDPDERRAGRHRGRRRGRSPTRWAAATSSAGEFRAGDGSTSDAAAARLAGLADRLAGRGLLVALEAFPWSALPDVGTAVELLRRAGSANAGLMIDVWHFFNGGATLDRARPTCRAPGSSRCSSTTARACTRTSCGTPVPPGGSPGSASSTSSGSCGQSRRAGFAGPWCVEVNTPVFRTLPVEAAAMAAADAARDVLDAARR